MAELQTTAAAAGALAGMYGPINGNDWTEDAERLLSIVEPFIAAKTLRAFADANRFPHHWIMFRRRDGYGVTVSDLLRERAAELEQEARDA